MAVYMNAERKSKLAISYVAKHLLNVLEQSEVFKWQVNEDIVYHKMPRHLLDTYKILDNFVGDCAEVVEAVGRDFMSRDKDDVLLYSDKNFIISTEYRNRFIERLEKIGNAADKDFDTNQAYTYVQIDFPGTPGPSGIYVLQYIGCEAARNRETQPYVEEDAVRKIMLRILENGPDSVIILS